LSLLPDGAPSDLEARLAIVAKEITRIVRDDEPQQRTMLRLSLEARMARERLVLRQGRAIGWIEDPLSPLKSRSSRTEFRRLVLAICSAIGIEALVWLTDVLGSRGTKR
jgi:hypothetical protein